MADHPRWRPTIVRQDANQHWIENLRYSIDVYDEARNLVEVLGRIGDLAIALDAFGSAVAKYPGKRIFLRDGARVIQRYDEPT